MKFIYNRITISREKYKQKELTNANKIYDLFITGSDQVWNLECTGYDQSYFLDFVEDDSKKNSYAASFAVDQLDMKDRDIVKTMLEGYEIISVREPEGANIVCSLMEKEVIICPDPTFLLNLEDWEKIKVDPMESEPYILVFCMGDSKRIWEEAWKIKRETEYKIVYINHSQTSIKGVLNIKTAGPSEWLGWISKAYCVITNSFHGCVFSTIFQRNFIYELTIGKKSNSRISNLMQQLDLMDRNIISYTKNEIDYAYVDERVAVLRSIGQKYLNKIVCAEKYEKV